ncbi:MarR family winged helix-turn-helix transcriptional regulator [Wenxinia marina]|uniref:Transcriptional regulator n=1 Tax=Wenxinia marina DSM 24838 TaxID=1123501 RepID=A0A0D0QDP9_9RHOB|nr:MarR family winged helix-turn-helix transcriptional regulator [Wenxinia marina]KIQ69123.1 Transcriptional regulator [Wenxinia marina DSM 24838]GGL70437.1 MarR family transcriptional regulator [Wenxinia marina]
MTPDTFRLSTFLPYRLAVLSERVSRRLTVDYERSHGLTMAEWRVLVHLQRSGPVSVREIRDSTNLDKPRVSRAVARLEAAGLVGKVAGQGDGRLVAISLTDAGRAALAEVVPSALAVDRRLREAVGPQDMAAFLRVMEAMHRVLDADPEARPRAAVDVEAAAGDVAD